MEVGTIRKEIAAALFGGVVPFWVARGVDEEAGGYLTCFDEAGLPTEDTDKYLVTQTRMLWGFSRLLRLGVETSWPDGRAPEGLRADPPGVSESSVSVAAEKGFGFLLRTFWDEGNGGWAWRTGRRGQVLDNGKLVYGQSFAVYALCEYYRAFGDPTALEYAERTFDLLQEHAADQERGGYYENLEEDWSVSAPGFHGGDRKSLDIHMHLMEAFTELCDVSPGPFHLDALAGVTELVFDKMIDRSAGCGGNQYDLAFNPIPPIAIRRTWNAEREAGEVPEEAADTTSYGHNVELAWLARRALAVAGEAVGGTGTPRVDNLTKRIEPTLRRLVDHSLEWGFDHELGGVYRDGPHTGPAMVRDKEWWQNCESLVGYLDAYEAFGDERYADAFEKTWRFAREYLFNEELGEFRQLVSSRGKPVVSAVGNPWKAFYHSGRALIECWERLAD